MDSAYRTVAAVQSENGRAPNDIHEFAVPPGGTAITTVFEPVQYDLSAYGVSQPVGWVLEGIFQEIDIQTGEVLFEWRSLDYTDLSESYNERGSFSEGGDGLTIKTAWDYLYVDFWLSLHCKDVRLTNFTAISMLRRRMMTVII